MVAFSTRTGSGERKKRLQAEPKYKKCVFLGMGHWFHLPPRCDFSRPVSLCDMHVSNPRQISWTVCVENVKPLSYLASSFGHNFLKVYWKTVVRFSVGAVNDNRPSVKEFVPRMHYPREPPSSSVHR